MVLRISASDGSFNDTKMRTTDNLHWSWQPLCARINVTVALLKFSKSLLYFLFFAVLCETSDQTFAVDRLERDAQYL